MRTLKNIRNRKHNQEKLKKDPQPLQTFVDNPIKSINQLNKSHKNVLNTFLCIRNNHVIVCPKVETIAKKTNLSVKRVFEIIGDLESWGFLNKIYDHFKSNIYIISSWFSDTKIRHQLRHTLWALRYVIIVPYLSTFFSEKDLRIEKCRQYYILSNSLFINNNILHTGIEYLRRERLPLRGTNLTNVDNVPIFRKPVTQKSRSLPKEKENKVSSVLDRYPQFNEEAKRQLSVFPESVLTYALQQMSGKRDLSNPFAYFRGVCVKKCMKDNVSYEQPDSGSGNPQLTLPLRTPSAISSNVVVKEIRRQEEKKEPNRRVPEWKPEPIQVKLKTAVQMASQVADFIEKQSNNPVFIFGLKGLLDYEYQLTGEENEQLAVTYLDAKRKQYCQEQNRQLRELETELGEITKDIIDYVPNEAKFQKDFTPLDAKGAIEAMTTFISRETHNKLVEYGISIPSFTDHGDPDNLVFPIISEPTKQTPENNQASLKELRPASINTVAGTPNTLEFEQESITIDEGDYDEVLD